MQLPFALKISFSNGPNDKHSLEEQFWHLAFTTSTVAPVRLARLGRLPRQANLPPHGGWRRNRKICHCGHRMSNQQSESREFPTQTWIALGKLVDAYNFTASLSCTAHTVFRNILDPASWELSQSCDSCTAALAAEIWSQMGQMTSTAWKRNSGTLLLQLQRWHRCEGQD